VNRDHGGKVRTAEEAVSLIPDGCTLGLGGFSITRNVIGMAHEIVRARRRDLTLVQVVGGMDTDLLVGAGCARRLLYSGGSLDRFGFLNAVNAAVGEGALETVEYSSLSLALRLHAGAMGLPYVPCRPMLGSDLLERLLESGDAATGVDPFGGGAVVLLPALRPDVAVVHVDQADPDGNGAIAGPHWAIRETALASRAVVLQAEEVVSAGSIDPNRVAIPGAVVTAVVPLAEGAHPTAVVGRYDFDREHLERYVGFSGRGRQGMAEYLDRYVYGVADHRDYLRLVGVGA
jgi:glutaconate CoA-transferase subunit A